MVLRSVLIPPPPEKPSLYDMYLDWGRNGIEECSWVGRLVCQRHTFSLVWTYILGSIWLFDFILFATYRKIYIGITQRVAYTASLPTHRLISSIYPIIRRIDCNPHDMKQTNRSINIPLILSLRAFANMITLQLHKLVKPKLTQRDASSGILPSRPRQVLLH